MTALLISGAGARALALAVLLVAAGMAARALTGATIVLPTFGVVDAPLSMRVVAICTSSRMPAGSRVLRPTALAVGDAGAYVADAERRTLERWNVPECRPTGRTALTGEVRGLAWADDGTLVALDATAGRALRFGADLTPLGTIDLRRGGVTEVRGLAIDGDRLAVLNGDGTIATFGVDGSPRARFAGAGSGSGQLSGPTAITPHRGGLLVADGGNRRVQLFSWEGAPLGSWSPPAPTVELASGPDDTAIGASPRAGALVALRPTARGFVVVSAPDGAELRVGGDVLAADQTGRVAGSSGDGIILLQIGPTG